MPVRGTPLCPLGYLPLKEGDWRLLRPASFSHRGDWRRRSAKLISPLEGEMAGRPEGGASRKRAS
ncbi:lytic murein transglycosylase [Mesorhizobium sp. B2-4-14]|nr:lytic murein transglycosylase [Mesorhizobium sp. B2-4-14]